MNVWKRELARHYSKFFGTSYNVYRWEKGPVNEIGPDFSVLEFPSIPTRGGWIYCTSCMALASDSHGIELFMIAPVQDHQNIELLTVVAHFHRTATRLKCGDTVDFGTSWGGANKCDCGLISLPYLFGPPLENLEIASKNIRILWLLPITRAEREYKIKFGLEALEAKFEDPKFNYLNQARKSVV